MSLELGGERGLLLDTNLLVLFIVGSVNPSRISQFKRTRAYDREAFQLLKRVIAGCTPIYTVPQVMAEVSNLTDMDGRERLAARRILASTIDVLEESPVSSARASRSWPYEGLGLTDGAISVVAEERNCAVLTDDLDLYLALIQRGLTAEKFSHLRERAWLR